MNEDDLQLWFEDLGRKLPAHVWVEHLAVRPHNETKLWKPVRNLLVRLALWVLRQDGLFIFKNRRTS